MQENCIELTTNERLWERLLEYGRMLAVLNTQINTLENICRTQEEAADNSGVISCRVLRDIFGFKPTKAQKVAANMAAGAAKARAAKAAKKSEQAKSPADMLKEIAEKKSKKDATPKDYTEIRGMQQAGLSIDDIVEETGFSKESILKLVNDSPKDAFD